MNEWQVANLLYDIKHHLKATETTPGIRYGGR